MKLLDHNAVLALALGFTYGVLGAKALRSGDVTQGVLLLLAGLGLAGGLWGARGATSCVSSRLTQKR